MARRHDAIRIVTLVNVSIATIFLISSVFIVTLVRSHFRGEALREAEQKARIILDRNLAIHTYFSHHLKPSVFALQSTKKSIDYFDPTWMSSTFAVREIDKISHTMNEEEYYYKECAINARSPENEADEFERAFISGLNSDPELKSLSEVRTIRGKQFFTVLRKGEVMEQSCLRCHSTPGQAPGGLVDLYGPERSFNRSVNEVVSAISIRIPLEVAYANADRTALHLSVILVSLLIIVLLVVMAITRKLIFNPLTKIKDKAVEISASEEHLGEQIPSPIGKEMEDLSNAFNRMSMTLRKDRDDLELKVQERTAELTRTNAELKKALDEVKTLSGLLPICAACKKVRDDKGYWQQIESFISEHSDAQFSHGLCPHCAEQLYPEYYKEEDQT